MKAWIYENKVCTVLPGEADPEKMGKIYDIDYHDQETLYDLEYNLKQAQRMLSNFHTRLAAKLRRDQD